MNNNSLTMLSINTIRHEADAPSVCLIFDSKQYTSEKQRLMYERFLFVDMGIYTGPSVAGWPRQIFGHYPADRYQA